MRIIAHAIAGLLLAGTTLGSTINVPADHPTIQGAIDVADDGDEIIVAPGTYTGTGDQVVDLLGKDITLRSSDGAAVTIIDAESERRGLVCSSGESIETIIDGFTIRNGFAAQAAGVYVLQSAPLIRDCTIENCQATTSGSGVILNDSPATFERCTITGNDSEGSGGGVLMTFSHATFIDCTISGNQSGGNGGGIWADQSEFTLSGCELLNNITLSDGAGLYMSGHFVEPLLENCTISGNTGIGTWADGGGISTYECVPTIKDCLISGNSVQGSQSRGGALACYQSEATLVNCELSNNNATFKGGGAWIYDCKPSITTCLLMNNESAFGGGVSCVNHAHATFEACEISGNHATNGGGLACLQFSSPHLVACLVRDNQADVDGGGVLSSTNGCSPAASLSCFCHNLPTHIDGWSWQDLGGNNFSDLCTDINGDGLPDECQCLPDIDGDGAVTIDDLLALLAQWGCTTCPAEDLDANGIVDIDDLLAIMANWGDCP